MKKKYFEKGISFLKKIKSGHSKGIHYFFLATVIIMEIAIVIIRVNYWRNETKKEEEILKVLNEADSWSEIAQLRDNGNHLLIDSQIHFNHYLYYKDQVSLDKYTSRLKEIRHLIDRLNNTGSSKKLYKDLLTKKIVKESIISSVQNTVNSIIHYESNYDKNSGKLIRLNEHFASSTNHLIVNYSHGLQLLRKKVENNLRNQYNASVKARNYTIIILMAFMFTISIILIKLTQSTFRIKNRLVSAQEEIKQNLNFKNRIVSMISHEIRSPLNIISIYNNKVSNSVNDTKTKDIFKTIQYTIDSLILLVNQILEYSKNENSANVLKKKKFRLKTELNQIISSMVTLVQNKGNKIEFYCDLDSDYEVFSDIIKIHQVFYNIIGNANKFTDDGLITVRINVERLSNDLLNLKIEVQDNGYGISENDLKRIFELHYQGAISEKVNNLGIGLGLNLCKEIVELFKGTIRVQSEKEKGTTVTFNLTLDKMPPKIKSE